MFFIFNSRSCVDVLEFASNYVGHARVEIRGGSLGQICLGKLWRRYETLDISKI